VPLSPAERRRLRARAHSLKPVVLVGDAGLSDGLLQEADRALEAHELIKVRLPAVPRDARSALAQALCTALDAQEVQTIGRVRVLFRPRPPKPSPPAAPRRRKAPAHRQR
jgi:RNA-binding protein